MRKPGGLCIHTNGRKLLLSRGQGRFDWPGLCQGHIPDFNSRYHAPGKLRGVAAPPPRQRGRQRRLIVGKQHFQELWRGWQRRLLVRKQGFQDLQGSCSAASSWGGDGSAASSMGSKASRNYGGGGSAASLWGSSASRICGGVAAPPPRGEAALPLLVGKQRSQDLRLRGSGSAASLWGSSASKNYRGGCGATSSWGSSASRICPVYNN